MPSVNGWVLTMTPNRAKKTPTVGDGRGYVGSAIRGIAKPCDLSTQGEVGRKTPDITKERVCKV